MRQPPARGPRLNRAIRAPQVRLLDADGTHLGVVPIGAALAAADAAGLDLVEISPGEVPVCRIADPGRLRYEQRRREQTRGRTEARDTKELKVGLHIAAADLETKCAAARRWLAAGHKVRVSVTARGREQHRPGTVTALLDRIVASLGARVEQPPRVAGRTTSILLAPPVGR